MASKTKRTPPGFWALEVLGDEELAKTLGEFRASAARAVLRPAITAGLKPIRKRARQLAPSRSGWLKKAIGSKAAVRADRIFGKVYVRSRPTSVDGKAYDPGQGIAAIVAFGHGNAAPRPFIRPALQEQGSTAMNEIRRVARLRIPIVVNRLRLKNKPVFKT